VRENRTGRSSHQAPPACFLLGADTGEFTGEAMGCQLAWSGNHRFALDRHDDGSLLLQAGEWLAPGEGLLEPGATLETPLMHLAWSGQGLDGVSAAFHAFVRRHVLHWPGGDMRPRPVHLNTWEAVYFDHDPERLKALATQAAKVGIERFVLDDGWFPARDHDRAGLGDWRPDPRKFPEGLGPLAAHVRGLGMEFGLWVEPEMVNPDSDLFRAHPDWALRAQGRPLVLGRHQLVLDLTRAEVADDLFGKLDFLLAAHPIAYLKWDMNRDLAQACDTLGRAAYRRHTRAVYALMARLRERHPQVEIESCASGGGRADLGVLALATRLWTSDNNDAVSRVAIQSGALRLFPPEVLGAHVGPAPAHATGRSQGIDFRCAVACFGHLGVEADLLAMAPDERTALAGWIAFHKRWRPVLHGGTAHQGTTASGLHWRLARTPDRAVLAVLTVVPPDHPCEPPLRLPPLAGGGRWRIRLARQAGQARARAEAGSPWIAALQGPGVTAGGDELARSGLPVPVMNPESALIFTFEAITG
jgi:alpha-galactosidase